MSRFEKSAKDILTSVKSIDDIETVESLEHLLKHPIEHSILKELKKAKLKNVKTVYYPGIATDILTPLIYTDCELLIGSDLVDESFYESLKMTKNTSLEFQVQVEAYYVANNFATIMSKLYELSSEFEEKAITKIDISVKKNVCKLDMEFVFLKKPRRVIIYIGQNATNFIPHECSKPDLIFCSAFTLDSRTMKKLKPKYVCVPESEGNDYLKFKKCKKQIFYGLRLDLLDVDLLFKYKNEINNKNSPFFMVKALELKKIFNSQNFEIYKI